MLIFITDWESPGKWDFIEGCQASGKLSWQSFVRGLATPLTPNYKQALSLTMIRKFSKLLRIPADALTKEYKLHP